MLLVLLRGGMCIGGRGRGSGEGTLVTLHGKGGVLGSWGVRVPRRGRGAEEGVNGWRVGGGGGVLPVAGGGGSCRGGGVIGRG